MKISKTASGTKKITMSKREWFSLGKKAGWLNASASTEEPIECIKCLNRNAFYNEVDDAYHCNICKYVFKHPKSAPTIDETGEIMP